ncbi:MAG: MOP flippase family protein [Coleofasciculus chthonoplastes F3-SA18-01]|uniref:MOP flippase family protein n=1 Tax=Coleofasciculus chthonoplastes TaxID=64178 RepID=UPI0032FD3207
MSIKQKAIKGALWTAIQNWVGQTGAFVVFFVLARLLQPEDFGLVALANVFLAFMQIFLEQGFAQALIQRDNLEPDHLNTAFWSNVAIGILLATLSFIGADGIAYGFQQPQLAPILRCLSLIFIINALKGTQQAILERKFAFKTLAVRSIMGIVIGGLVGIIMAIAGFGVWSLVGQQLTNELMGTLVLWNASKWRPGFSFSFIHFKQLFKFGSNILVFNFISFFNTRLNDFLIGYFLGTTALGYYGISYRILQVGTQLLVKTTSGVSLPTFSRLINDLDRFRSAFYAVTRLTSVVAFPVFVGMGVLAPELVTVLFGQQWLPTVPLIQLLAISGVLRSVSFFKSSVLVAMGYPVWTVRLKLLSVVLNIVGFAIAYRWGIVAVTAATVIRSIIVFPIGQWVISKIVDIPLWKYLGQFAVPLISSLGMMTVLLISRKYLEFDLDTKLSFLFTNTLLGAITYLLLIRTLSPKIFSEFINLGKIALSKSQKKTQKIRD